MWAAMLTSDVCELLPHMQQRLQQQKSRVHMHTAKDGMAEVVRRYEQIEAQIDQNLQDFHSMLDAVREQYSTKMLDAKAEAKVCTTNACTAMLNVNRFGPQDCISLASCSQCLERRQDCSSV